MSFVKEQIKTVAQRWILPAAYRIYRKPKVNKNQIILADAHHDSLPYSMWQLKEALERDGRFEIIEICKDYQQGSYLSIIKSMFTFVKFYANAEFVAICDNHLPVASCKKRAETKVIQLWHSGGALKRFGYDSPGNIPDSYRGGNVYANYDLITVSADYAVAPFCRAMKTTADRIGVFGISRTDWYFDEAKKQALRDRYEQLHPQAAGKTIVVWAPTFRGNAGNPRMDGIEEVLKLREELKETHEIIIKLHPHARRHFRLPEDPMLTEELMPAADIMISDYSSIIYDFAYFAKPLILFTPDLEQYQLDSGFYEDYDSIPAYRAQDYESLRCALLDPKHAQGSWSKEAAKAFWQRTMSACDGKASERIIDWMLSERKGETEE